MYDLIRTELDEIYESGRWNSVKKFAMAKDRIRALLDIDPLNLVYSVPEVAKKLDMGEVQVRRKIYDGTLQARKSGGTWLVKLG